MYCKRLAKSPPSVFERPAKSQSLFCERLAKSDLLLCPHLAKSDLWLCLCCCRVANAVRALAALYLSIYPATIMDAYEVSLGGGTV